MLFCLGDTIDLVFEKACQKKSWDQFTKPQRKTISQWRESAQELRREMDAKIHGTLSVSLDGVGTDTEPPTKRMKTDIGNISC